MIVLIEDAIPIGGDKDVRPAIVVVVADGYTHSEIGPGNTGFFGDIGEGAVAIIFVEGVANGLAGLPEIAGAAIDQENIHPAIIVVVEEGAAGAQRFREEPARRYGVFVNPIDFGVGRRNFEEEWRSCRASLGLKRKTERPCGTGGQTRLQESTTGKNHPNILP